MTVNAIAQAVCRQRTVVNQGRDPDSPNNEALDWLDSKAQEEDKFLAFSTFLTHGAQVLGIICDTRYEKAALGVGVGVKPERPS